MQKVGKKDYLFPAGMMVMAPERLFVIASKRACTKLGWVGTVQVSIYI